MGKPSSKSKSRKPRPSAGSSPKASSSSPEQLADALTAAGAAHFESGNVEEAYSAFLTAHSTLLEHLPDTDRADPSAAATFFQDLPAEAAAAQAADPSARRALVHELAPRASARTVGAAKAARLLPLLGAVGEAALEVGEMAVARAAFACAASFDPDGAAAGPGGGAVKFLWLAQLSDEGGRESVAWFGRGIKVLERELAAAEARTEADRDELAADVEEKKQKLASAYCGVAEVYMTDLSFDDAEAEQACEAAIAAALAVCPEDPDVLQTLASIRISQTRLPDARVALARSLATWWTWPDEEEEGDHAAAAPPFPTRIALARMLAETEMLTAATEVAERLVLDDDESVEAWYLGGWAYWLRAGRRADPDAAAAAARATGGRGCVPVVPEDFVLSEIPRAEDGSGYDDEDHARLLRRARWFIQNCLRKYKMVGYEDEKLHEHAVEIIGLASAELSKLLNREVSVEEEEEDESDLEDDENDDDDMTDI